MITIRHNFDPEQFQWLWAKYVNGGDISQRCYACLKGRPSKKFSKAYNPDMADQPVIVMDEMAEGDYDAVYFCGVSKKALTTMCISQYGHQKGSHLTGNSTAGRWRLKAALWI